ncbi:hypothetical protein GCM10010252_76960 [Streptomyces aureoverticillatus]|nr:hypothetical protein GCM10010252_76960 [Streptomyces aureoverticillatus]
MSVDLRHRSFLKELDFSSEEFRHLLDLSARLKADRAAGSEHRHLRGRTAAYHHERTVTMGGQIHRGGAQQQPGETAQAPAADHRQRGRTRLDLQHFERLSVHYGPGHLDARRDGVRPLLGPGQCAPHHRLQTVSGRAPRCGTRRQVDGGVAEGVHETQRRPAQPRLPGGEIDRAEAGGGAVHSYDHRITQLTSPAS